uniref:Uncharacterized protein n=1 Tax=Setaria viridis TaxID=4556 RepID=A0A4U6V6C0_SETVI|nr:hypothetical protein SEVIR_4G015702v2 [Setaria viridis]
MAGGAWRRGQSGFMPKESEGICRRHGCPCCLPPCALALQFTHVQWTEFAGELQELKRPAVDSTRCQRGPSSSKKRKDP